MMFCAHVKQDTTRALTSEFNDSCFKLNQQILLGLCLVNSEQPVTTEQPTTTAEVTEQPTTTTTGILLWLLNAISLHNSTFTFAVVYVRFQNDYRN